ncbi:MAG: hypothetical protein A3I89_00480 [Candidatus Harrisonbacteria bacterium RIFCSPLOWO2_02_FULL_41_11]|nr:MAG: hypothetical protein A3I89_00480 [Candidatus Harrisonbacteria bacterium RIFCSPLOWO2_02_FULL_41_11]
MAEATFMKIISIIEKVRALIGFGYKSRSPIADELESFREKTGRDFLHELLNGKDGNCVGWQFFQKLAPDSLFQKIDRWQGGSRPDTMTIGMFHANHGEILSALPVQCQVVGHGYGQKLLAMVVHCFLLSRYGLTASSHHDLISCHLNIIDNWCQAQQKINISADSN